MNGACPAAGAWESCQLEMSYQFQIVDEERRFEWSDAERFDRIEFALRVIGLVRLNMDVTVYTRSRSLQIRRGRNWAIGPDVEWAMLGIPSDASRSSIVYAVAELAGVAHVPFLVDLIAEGASVA